MDIRSLEEECLSTLREFLPAGGVSGRLSSLGSITEQLYALVEENSSLQKLVCYLLYKNEHLREQVRWRSD